jgi:hypothetical protein
MFNLDLVSIINPLFNLKERPFMARAMVYWLRQTAHDQEVMSLDPATVYWLDVSDVLHKHT